MNKLKDIINNKRIALFEYSSIIFFAIIGFCVRLFCKVKKRRVLLWADDFRGYGCNPKALSDYILENDLDYELFWAFQIPEKYYYIDNKIKRVRKMSMKFVYVINTSQFIITNHRTYPLYLGWKKRKEQRYIMTWHGTMGVKKVELEKARSKQEIERAQLDARICDVMMSDSEWFDGIIRNAIGYKGPILRNGMPRNDIYYDSEKREKACKKIRDTYGLEENKKIVLYAPTFRNDYSTECYLKNWQDIKDQLKLFLGGEPVILVRYHQVLKKYNIQVPNGCINATDYDDMQELLCSADLLITDYSSTMFDMGLMKKPCILFASDIKEYDRGLNFELTSLPMPVVVNEKELKKLLIDFDKDKYLKDIENFYKDVFHVYKEHCGCLSFCNWMKEQ